MSDTTPTPTPTTGPEHYAEATRLLADVATGYKIVDDLLAAGTTVVDPIEVAAFNRSVDVGIARAQAHATAAQAAATALHAAVARQAAGAGLLVSEQLNSQVSAWLGVAGGTVHNLGTAPVDGEAPTVWTVIVADPRADNEPWLFSDREQAIDFARQWALDKARLRDDLQEPPVAGCAYFGQYAPDARVWVVGKKLNQAVTK